MTPARLCATTALKWTRNIVVPVVTLVILFAVFSALAVSLTSSSSGERVAITDAPSPSSCKDLIDEYLNKYRSNPDSIWIGIDGPGTSGFIDCPNDAPPSN